MGNGAYLRFRRANIKLAVGVNTFFMEHENSGFVCVCVRAV